ncbi:MAG: C25 family cysteine peptidase [Euryarchaeota archaeon]|nr:C25 family cysteine peptidase [Euryarchaeota archaeon]
MKKTTISYFVVGLLLISGFAAIGLGKEAGTNQTTMNLQFVAPNFTEKTIDRTTYAVVTVEGANRPLNHAGQPMLPMYTTELNFPFGTNIINVEFVPQEVKTMVLPDKIIPAPQPVIPDMGDNTIQYNMDETIYNSASLFPENWASYYTGGGIDSNYEHKTFLTVQVYPARYSPATNTIKYAENGVLTITYTEPQTNPFPAITTYDLVIIAPSKFSGDLQKLVDHKISKGVTTILKTTDGTGGIYNEFTGVDKPEQIKYFIKYAIETWGTKYILLVGGMDSIIFGVRKDDVNQGSKDWLVPVRYTNLWDTPPIFDAGFISDLYYADIYNGDGSFSSWDTNHDSIFAKWHGTGKDIIDLFPDVAVGRLACRNKIELKIMINKIINYEKQPAGSWFNNMILVGGDSHDDRPYGTNYIEGEYVCDYAYNHFMTEFTPVKVYASNKDTNPDMVPTTDNLVREISNGSGHLLFDGHGNPAVWNTHYPDDFTTWVGGIKVFNFYKLRNGGKLPVAVVGGCHNSMFNNTLLSTLMDGDNNASTWVYGMPVPEDFSWMFARKLGGGTIATMGNTGLGYGTIGENGDIDGDGVNDPDCAEALGGYQERMFYQAIDNGFNILGDAWVNTTTEYLKTFPGMADQIDCKTVEQWPIIGDPSLKIGGYPATEGLKAKIDGAEAGVVAAPSEIVTLHGAASDGQEPYTYEWDIEKSDGTTYHATGSEVSYTWNLPGAYWVSLKVTDGNGEVSVCDTIVGLEPDASTPTRPEGATRITAGETYTYTTGIGSTNWDSICYKFSWGDGTESDWVETPSASHSWGKKGVYVIKVKTLLVRLENENSITESDWSTPLAIRVPRYGPSMTILEKLFERFPNAFPILRHLLGV